MSAAVLFREIRCSNQALIGVATLNVEKSLNALSLEMVQLLDQQLLLWAEDRKVVLVILEAAGEKAFCAGGDLLPLYHSMREHHASDQADDCSANIYAGQFFSTEYALDYLIHHYPKPVLCWGHGIVMGGGVGLMAGASHKVVTETSRVAMPEISIGLFPDVGGSWLLSRMPQKSGLFLALTGAQIRAADCLFVGMADVAILQARKNDVIDALGTQAWTTDRTDNDARLTALLASFSAPELSQAGPLQQHLPLINTLCKGNSITEIVDTIKANEIDDPWFAKAVATLRAGSPTSAALAHALLQKASAMDLADVFRLEYVAALRCATGTDFAEGIRALLVDKSGNPNWIPASTEALTPAMLNHFFTEPAWHQHPLHQLGKE
ncbi:enoyl-CoA hydratase/isomerase family protein [Undibacterium sp. RuRC25W]|uniref:enoyl-CoA hydratase/isomerase family protein n=1 Tax=Undibacterium sp. RuRC25W TaxID=3413047 RepID=UPI003BF29944